MTISNSTVSQPGLWRRLARQYLGGRIGLFLAGGAILILGAGLSWGWLVAAGVAPLILSLAPCALMCALGLCMTKMGSSASKASETAPSDGAVTPPTVGPSAGGTGFAE